MSEDLRTLLQNTEEQLQKLTIVFCRADSNSRFSAMQHMHPACSLQIPNEFYVLANRKNNLEKMIGVSISKHLEMANEIIQAEGIKISRDASMVETRLERESDRYLAI